MGQRSGKQHLKALERRRDYLAAVEDTNSYDRAELSALNWAISVCQAALTSKQWR